MADVTLHFAITRGHPVCRPLCKCPASANAGAVGSMGTIRGCSALLKVLHIPLAAQCLRRAVAPRS